MANSQFVLTFTTQDSAQAVKDRFLLVAQSPSRSISNIGRYLSQMASGVTGAKILCTMNAVAATGTLTLAAVVATDTVVVNGVTYTAVASGATAVQFNVGGTDTITATNLAATLNAATSTSVKGVIVATSSGAVVTITSIIPGNPGNAISITGGAHITASGTRLTGGTADAGITISHGV